MKKLRKMRSEILMSLSAALVFATLSCASQPRRAQVLTGCGDFLSELEKKPEHLTYTGCEISQVAQLKALKASYVVSGTNAKSVEQKLIENFKIKPLGFYCCGWESLGDASFVDKHEHTYEINMSSEETIEKDWRAIKVFHVSVYRFLELP